MEKRTVDQVKVFRLVLNPVNEVFESARVVAFSSSYDSLRKYCEGEVDERIWRGEDKLLRVFKKGSKLENYHIPASLDLNRVDYCGHGIRENWINEDDFNKMVDDVLNGQSPLHYAEPDENEEYSEDEVVECCECDGECDECTCESSEEESTRESE